MGEVWGDLTVKQMALIITTEFQMVNKSVSKLVVNKINVMIDRHP
jgi:hypothetical protein